jgi:hypothetical protein
MCNYDITIGRTRSNRTYAITCSARKLSTLAGFDEHAGYAYRCLATICIDVERAHSIIEFTCHFIWGKLFVYPR